MNPRKHERPGLRVHPPVVYLAALLAGVGLNRLRPISPLSSRWAGPAGIALIVVGLAIMPFVLRRFRRAGTTFHPHKPASALITDGPYRFSRNPAYVALTLWYLGLGLVLDNAWILLLVLGPLLIMDRLVIPREERYLEERFGREYRRYKAAVRRWL